MSKPWENQAPLTNEQVREIISSETKIACQFIEKLGEGWDNTTYLVDGTWCFRFPRHQEAATLLENEIRVLTHLPPLNVQVPTPKFIIKSSPLFPYIIYGHHYLEGITADQYSLNDDERIMLAPSLAEFLKTLHQFSIEKAVQLGIGYDPLDRIKIGPEYEKIKERLDYLKANELIKSTSPWIDFLAERKDFVHPNKWVLGHGDFYAKHLVLNEGKQLAGVIDWGDAEILHPAMDLAIVYKFIPISGHDIFWDVYGEVDDTTKMLAKCRAIYNATTLAWYAHHVNDIVLLKEELHSLNYLLNN